MEKNKPNLPSPQLQEEPESLPEEAKTENAEHPADEEHTHTNYRYAFKVLAVLLGIILLLVILKVSGVRFAIKDLFAGCIAFPAPPADVFIPKSLF